MNYTHTERSWVVTEAALEVRGSDLDPERISEHLGLDPTGSRRPGPDRWDPEADEAGLWLLKVSAQATPLAEQLDELLGTVEPRAVGLQELRQEGYDVLLRLFGFVGTGSFFELSPVALGRLTALGVPLRLAVSTSER
ncbi:DUF4279 domain-containing protein [Streptomyces hoynatensis]|uniref:DUF4279 domain-containing protein n=1 Tax=Streptomyces hoynatensis TaxID=1141874 RepID=UPI00131A09E4|nr:DUF4279 domain-containing protein [Streptomyces hoynatensis]